MAEKLPVIVDSRGDNVNVTVSHWLLLILQVLETA
jgi:hypothetical protein